MDEEVVLAIVAFMTIAGIGGYLLGRARAARDYLERLGNPRPPAPQPIENTELKRIEAAVETMTHRFDLVEQRLDFAERLVDAAQRKAFARPSTERWKDEG